MLTNGTQAALHGTDTSAKSVWVRVLCVVLDSNAPTGMANQFQILSACKYGKKPYCIQRLLRLLSGMSQVRVLSALCAVAQLVEHLMYCCSFCRIFIQYRQARIAINSYFDWLECLLFMILSRLPYFLGGCYG